MGCCFRDWGLPEGEVNEGGREEGEVFSYGVERVRKRKR